MEVPIIPPPMMQTLVLFGSDVSGVGVWVEEEEVDADSLLVEKDCIAWLY